MKPLLIKIQRRLMKPHVWRFVGLASTVVGLSCYALSSSFNHLFGEWNLLKTFVYSVFSIIICLLISFAKAWQHPRSHRLEAHAAFFVLTMTAVYSFLLDKAVKGKPDAYSLVSCVAFALTCLSLSRQTHRGVEVDLLYFFLGALIVQLMKIKMMLGVIGVAFGYSLVILRSSLESKHLTFQDQHHVVVVQVDSNLQQAVQVDSDSQQANTNFAPITLQFTACIEELKTHNGRLISMLSKDVTKFINAIVDSNYREHIPVDNNLVIDTLQSDITDKLHEAVKIMLAAGFQKECCNPYSNCRREFSKEWLTSLGLRLPNIEDTLTKTTVNLEYETANWMKASYVAMRFLFPNERRLCERVFLGYTASTDLAFTEVCRDFTIDQLDWANYFALGSPNPFLDGLEALPLIPKLYKTLHDLIPEYDSLFSDQSTGSIRNEAINTRKRLRKATKKTFKRLEGWLCRHRTVELFYDGLDPTSNNVMKCLCGICEVWNAFGLEKVFEERPMFADGEGTYSWEGTSSLFSTGVSRIIELLHSHLEVKSRDFTDDPARRSVVMMNNGRHMEQKAIDCQSRTGTIFQDSMIRKLNAKLKQNLEDYQKSTWDQVIGLLKQGGKEPEAAESMKENIKLFNMHVEKIRRAQSKWHVHDEELRKEIRKSIQKILLPAYGMFLGKLRDILGSHADEYIQYSKYDIDGLLNDLFIRGPIWEEFVW